MLDCRAAWQSVVMHEIGTLALEHHATYSYMYVRILRYDYVVCTSMV